MTNNSSSARGWNNMDYDILVKIFMALNVMDLISGVSQVCSLWRSACCDPALWKKLDLSNLNSNSSLYIPQKPYAWSDDQSSKNLMKILKTGLNLSQGNVNCLIFHFYVFIENEHLIYAAERSRDLKRLILPAWNQLSVRGFREAFKIWEGLESLTVPCLFSPMEIMQLIGTYCKNFSELKIMCPFDQDFANALIRYLPKLKVLSLRCTMVYKDALIRILDNLKHLEVLNISHCLFVLVQDSVVTSIMVYRQLDRKIIEKGSQLREFLTCQTGSCSTCQRAAADEGILKWYEYEEARWREDEISSLAH